MPTEEPWMRRREDAVPIKEVFPVYSPGSAYHVTKYILRRVRARKKWIELRNFAALLASNVREAEEFFLEAEKKINCEKREFSLIIPPVGWFESWWTCYGNLYRSPRGGSVRILTGISLMLLTDIVIFQTSIFLKKIII